MAFAIFDRFNNTHHLVAAKYNTTGSGLETLPISSEALAGLVELETATDDLRKVEDRGGESIGLRELVYGVPNAHIVNATFCHSSPHGGRFNRSGRGAWYAGVKIRTAISEVVFHKRLFLENGGVEGEITARYVDYLADLHGDFHHLNIIEARQCLKTGPVPQCYQASQALAVRLLYEGSSGIVYRSVRAKSGTCVACFRPALVNHVRIGKGYRLTVEAGNSRFHVESFQPN